MLGAQQRYGKRRRRRDPGPNSDVDGLLLDLPSDESSLDPVPELPPPPRPLCSVKWSFRMRMGWYA